MENLVVLDKIVETSWESLILIGGIFLAIIIWMVVSRGNSGSSNDKEESLKAQRFMRRVGAY